MDRAAPAADRGSLSAATPVVSPIGSSGPQSGLVLDAIGQLEWGGALGDLALALAALPGSAPAGLPPALPTQLHAVAARRGLHRGAARSVDTDDVAARRNVPGVRHPASVASSVGSWLSHRLINPHCSPATRASWYPPGCSASGSDPSPRAARCGTRRPGREVPGPRPRQPVPAFPAL